MTKRRAETWRPPLFHDTSSRVGNLIAPLRRFFDLQAGSLWKDLSEILPSCDGVVLDVGCGAQPYRPLLGRAKYIGLDTADASAHFGYEIPDTIYFEGDRWPLEDGSVDVVLCTETLEHVADPAKFLSEIARVLRPAGELILTVPFAARYHFIPHDYWRFTPAGLQQLLEATGFRNAAVFARGNAVTVACYKMMALMLPLLFGNASSAVIRVLRRAAGLALSPVILAFALIANASLRGRGGDDCLGYTVLARRSAANLECS
jgi:SAM-dependent methyltransferase